MGEVFKEYSEKNHTELPALTIIQGGGTVKREESDRNLMYDESNLSNYKMVRKDDFIVHLRSFEGGLEKSLLDGIISPAYHTFHSDVADSRFYYPYFRSHEFIKHKLVPHVYGIRDGRSIDIAGMKTIEIPYTSIEEQRKIGDYLESLDHLITFHQRKKRRIYTTLTIVWEQRKVSDVAERFDNLRVPVAANLRVSGDTPYYGANGIQDYVDGFTHDGEFVLVAEDGAYDLVNYPVNYVNGRVWVNNHAHVLQGMKNICDNRFLSYAMSRADIASVIVGGGRAKLNADIMMNIQLNIPLIGEQKKIGTYFSDLDNLITLHQWKCEKSRLISKNDWEQRKLGEVFKEYSEKNHTELPALTIIQGGGTVKREESDRNLMYDESNLSNYKMVRKDDFIVHLRSFEGGLEKSLLDGIISPAYHTFHSDVADSRFYYPYFRSHEFIKHKLVPHVYGIRDGRSIDIAGMKTIEIPYTSIEEQRKIGDYLESLDHLITLHQREVKLAEKAFIYTEIQLFLVKEITNMAELEALIEQKLIDQLVYGDSQWTYRQDLKTEADLWNNFRYILEQNNKERLNGEPLTDAEFDQVKNQLQFSSFYKAGEWLVGENGKVMVHVQRDTEKLHLVVMNHEHIAGGSSVYEVINQYQALDTDGNSAMPARDRRFDVTLMINGLPMIHIELKNKQHPYMDGFRQIKKYIGEGKFTGIFSAVQMFVVSNGVDTKYFAAASDRELNDKFISGWVDNDNNPVTDYLDFAKSVLRIPQAHEMIARYTVLDEDAKRLIILRPYQIHAIEAIRDASKNGKSGFVWHTTGSGKTLTSYKATRNLLMDIPSLDKTIFLIDRKDLDTQTTQAFQAYANNDLIDVDETDNVFDLKNKLKSDDRQVIVTTIQKLQILITKRLKEGTSEYDKIKNRRIAFVVDECHRAVTPNTKRLIERFFGRSLWYGFTGTPRFAENPYPQMGDLPRTTE